MAYVLFRSLHLIAAVVLAGALTIKNLATGRLISQQDANHLAWLSILVCSQVSSSPAAALRFGSGPESRQRFTAKTLSSRSR